jgi:stage II sporulation protein D
VAARSYAAHERAHSTSYYDICDTTSCQVYGGYDAEAAASNAAVKATRGRVVMYDGAPAFTQFSSSNGGWSSPGTEPYLVAQPDPYEAASGNPYATWTTTVTTARIEKEWPSVGTLQHITITRDGHGDFGGRILTAELQGSAGSLLVPGDDLRALLGDAGRSTWFRLDPVQPRS